MKESSVKKQPNRLVLREEDVRQRIRSGLDKITLPVIQTISPKGKNVLYEDSAGNYTLTNDGVTIAKAVDSDDRIEQAIIEIVKDAARRTNLEAGDGTSTTILLSRILINKTEDLKARGVPQKEIRDLLERVAEKILKRLEAQKKTVKDTKTLKEIATISANNDAEIAKQVVETIESAGLDGLVILDVSNDEKTKLEKQPGYRIPSGMVYQNLYADSTKPQVAYKDIPVIIFDKKLYYAEEAEHILRVAKDSGHSQLAIIAKDFLGDAPNTFIANHMQGVIKLVLVKVDDETKMEDVAVYIGGTIVSEAGGRRVDSINYTDFTIVESVFADPQKVLIKTLAESKTLKKRVLAIKEELAKDKDNQALKERLSSLTNGVVTIKVGGRTPTEMREKLFRYEDAINAVRAAQKNGYLVGGGLSLYHAYDKTDYSSRYENEMALAISRASVAQIAENAMEELDYEKLQGDIGLNALTGKYENLLKSGVVEPFRATEMALKNAVSVANAITSIGTFIVYAEERDESAGGEGR